MESVEKILKRAISLAERYKAEAAPNPPVGAAVLLNNEVVFGAHQRCGSPHAEVNAIKKALNKFFGYNLALDDNLTNLDFANKLANATLFITLEPCSTYGKQPPCTEAILKSGIKKVYIGTGDPNPKNSARGIELLRANGVEVEFGILADDCNRLIEHFIKAQRLHKPYVTLKSATSLDGRITDNSNNSKWITSLATKQKVFKMRSSHQAILTGINTVLLDDPLLTDRRRAKIRSPIRFVLDSHLRLPLDSKLARSAKDIRTVVYCLTSADCSKKKALENEGVEVRQLECLEIEAILSDMYENLSIIDLMVEAGANLSGSFFDAKSVDRWELFLAPKVIGGSNALNVILGKGLEHLSEVKPAISVDIKKVEPKNEASDLLITSIFNKYY